ncbi:MAG: hypothetical protein AABZ68_05885, partial [Candidatus Deferrimicrobiota bacterium]
LRSGGRPSGCGIIRSCSAPPGIEGMMEGIRALALTGYDLFADPSLVNAAWRQFHTAEQGRS